MSPLLFILTIVALSTGCSTSTSTQEQQPNASVRSAVVDAPVISVPDNPADREIRRLLNLAISHDDALKTRDISFIVANGDVSVTGTVRSEEERKKINEMALNISGVKSVANGLLITE